MVYPRDLEGDAPVLAQGGGGAVGPHILDRPGGDVSDAARPHASNLLAHSAAQGLAAYD